MTVDRPLPPGVRGQLDRPSGPVATRGGGALLTPLALGAVRLATGGFLGDWQERSGRLSISHCIRNLETSGVLHNFRRLTEEESGDFIGFQFADSDLYKTLEAIGWECGRTGRLEHAEFVDQAIDLIAGAQAPSGYLNTAIQGDPSKRPWEDLIWSHEMYCAGHLVQAAIALERGAGDPRLLVIARRFADHIVAELSDVPEAYDGHAEIETALVELYRETGEASYLEFAEMQIRRRGTGLLPVHPFGSDYFGDHATVDQIEEATGHAVRQLYFVTGVVDLYVETGDSDLLAAAKRIWDSAFATKTYLTGGHGSRHADESFGDPYELPPDRAYAETCAGIASFQWNWRMLLVTGEPRYADAMETVLYNTIAAASALDGTRFFYTNPLQMRTGHRGSTDHSPSERLPWFACACCPPNLARLIASLGEYISTQTADGIQLHQLAPAAIAARIGNRSVTVRVETGVPWTGGASISVDGEGTFELAVRIPEWARRPAAHVAGVAVAIGDDGYLRVSRDWVPGDRVELEFELIAVGVEPNARIDAVRNTIALRRGPLVYCLEGIDQPAGVVLEDIRLTRNLSLNEVPSTAPGVIVALSATGVAVSRSTDLYFDVGRGATPRGEPVPITAIPYFAWGNRGRTSMRVWIPTS